MEHEKDLPVISPFDLVTVTQMKHILEVQYMEKMNTGANIRKLDKYRYVDLKTGEVREFELSTNRKENYNSLRQTFKKLRFLINNNFEGKANELHITLTYEENMTDSERLYDDFRKFIQRLRYSYRDKSTVDYINVVEPQERGAWHCHFLIRFNDLDKIYIPNAELAELWGQGFVTIKSLKDVDNIGAYLSAYLTDIDIEEIQDIDTAFKIVNENREIVTKEVEGKEKKFIKGGRLHMYPPGMNIFRKSKGIEYPERKKMQYGEVKKIVRSAQPHYTKSYHVQNDDFESTITFEQYNLKR